MALVQVSSPQVAWDGPALVADDGRVFLSKRCEGALAPAPAVEERPGAGPHVLFGEAGSRGVHLDKATCLEGACAGGEAAIEIGTGLTGIVFPEAWIGKGRVAALEILVGVPALRNLIREDKTTQIQSVMQVGEQHGMQTLDQALKDLVIGGKITREAAVERSTNPRLFDGPAGHAAGAASGAGAGAAAGTTAARA
ncbi:MAG TPA: hypothetical protein VFB81_24745 [Myxococcales bacterium]|nr:hypothetical protein [Myxococcales bacterium]